MNVAEKLNTTASNPKALEPTPITAPPLEQRVKRNADFVQAGNKKTRYSLPEELQSSSPVGFRKRIAMSEAEIAQCYPLLSMERPTAFSKRSIPTEQELFEECSLGVLSARQSTNYRGHRSVIIGPEESQSVARLLAECSGGKEAVLEGTSYTHVVFSRPYRTPFTLLLTFVGHLPLASFFSVPLRALKKRFADANDIPTIGYLQQIHVGVLADAMERATAIASDGHRRAQIHLAPFTGGARKANRKRLRAIEAICGLTAGQRAKGWRIALVAQVGEALAEEKIAIEPSVARKLGANLMAFRSERIQPGVNAEPKAPPAYQKRQEMNVPDELTVMAGRAAYNAFAHWTGCDRERSKDLLLLERIDVLTKNGKERIRAVREQLSGITDKVMRRIPLWVDLPTGRAFSRNAKRGKKAFALAGQRIYIAGLSKRELAAEGIDWDLACRALGGAAARSSLLAELMGVTNLPDDCDLLAGVCLMAGPVNQNDIGKSFYGVPDLLHGAFPDRDPTSLLVWTMKAKTIADPIGNEEQLLNPERKGALVDLRTGPHQSISISRKGALEPMRKNGDAVNEERAFSDLQNFVTSPDGRQIQGNSGRLWSSALRNKPVW
jgi:hypothetical protein